MPKKSRNGSGAGKTEEENFPDPIMELDVQPRRLLTRQRKFWRMKQDLNRHYIQKSLNGLKIEDLKP